MRPIQLDIDVPDVDPNGIAEDQQPTTVVPFVLNGNLSDSGTPLQFDIGDSYSAGVGGVQISFESTGNWGGVTITIVGLNQDGISTTETLSGPNNNTVEANAYWSQILAGGITVSGTVGTNIEVGTVDEVITKTLPLNWRANEAFTIAVKGLSGAINFKIDESFDQTATAEPVNWAVSQNNQTADLTALLTIHARATRLVVNSYSSGAELQFHVLGN